jgi:ribosomal protein S8E
MHVTDTQRLFNGAVRSRYKATLRGTPDEIDMLRQALSIIEQWKAKAKKSLKIKENQADWTMYRYNLLVKDGVVVVDIEQGACG